MDGERYGEAHREDGAGTSVWVTLGIGALVGAAGYALLAGRADDFERDPDSAPGRAARQSRFDGYAVTGRTVTINRPRQEVFAFWREFTNLPRFMENVRDVKWTGNDTTVWSIEGPGGGTVDYEARLVEDRPGELIAWRTQPGADVEAEGKVRFRDAPGGRGTEVEAIIAYKPPAGELGRWIATIFQREPAIQGRRELKRLKMLMETGEVATARMKAAG